MVSLELHRQAGDHELDLVSDLGDGLVQKTSRIAEAARQRVVRHDAKADLIGHEDYRALLPSKCRGKQRSLMRPVAPGMKQVGEPQRQAIDEPCAAAVGLTERLHEIERRLALDPVI